MQININRLLVRANHGVMPLERTVGQDFEVSVTLNVDSYDGSDNLASTVNYAEVCDLIVGEMQIPSDLIEHAASRLCNAILGNFPAVKSGTLTLTKLAPPIPYPLASVSVTLSF
ncbi:MAG: dihydroneopterin aldolase [Bacteroidales bacterium]|nr:dihydroneopterin aldolase [Bacteroidales bacterium]